MLFLLLIMCSVLIVACSGDKDDKNADKDSNDEPKEEQKDDKEENTSENVPKEVIDDADADPIELKDQMDLAVGDTGYTVSLIERQEVAITLNGVEETQTFGEETREGDEHFFIGDFTFENLGDERFTVEEPHAADIEDKEEIQRDEFDKKEELVGIPAFGNPNSFSLDPGEKRDQKLALSMKKKPDEYMVIFGYDDGNNKYYRNKVAWVIDSSKVEKVDSMDTFQ